MINSNVWNGFISLFYPKICFICDQSLLSSEQCICTHCLLDLPLFNNNSVEEVEKFEKKFASIQTSTFQFALMQFHPNGPAQKLLHKLKYEGQYDLGVYLGKMIGRKLNQQFDSEIDKLDFIIPIPIHKSKRKARGYNQSEAIVEGIAEVTKTEMDFTSLIRTKKTKTQTKKSKVDRWRNVSSIYELVSYVNIEGKNILLVDDVVTTGATIIEAADLLIKYKASSIQIACIATEI